MSSPTPHSSSFLSNLVENLHQVKAAMKTEALDRKSLAQFYCVNILPEMEAYGVMSKSGQKSLYNFTDNFFGFSQ